MRRSCGVMLPATLKKPIVMRSPTDTEIFLVFVLLRRSRLLQQHLPIPHSGPPPFRDAVLRLTPCTDHLPNIQQGCHSWVGCIMHGALILLKLLATFDEALQGPTPSPSTALEMAELRDVPHRRGCLGEHPWQRDSGLRGGSGAAWGSVVGAASRQQLAEQGGKAKASASGSHGSGAELFSSQGKAILGVQVQLWGTRTLLAAASPCLSTSLSLSSGASLSPLLDTG